MTFFVFLHKNSKKRTMSKILWLIGFGLMIWCLIDYQNGTPNLYVQILAVVVFFVAMMRLSNKTSSNFDKNNQDHSNQNNSDV